MTHDQPEHREFQSLILAVQAGDQEAARVLHDDYYRHVIAVVRRSLMDSIRSKFDSQDFAQTVWAILFSDLSKLNGITEPTQLIRLLTSIARNKVTDENRRRTQTQKHSVHMETIIAADDDGQMSLIGNDPTPSQCAIAHETRELFESRLAPEHLQILELKIEGQTNQAIADKLRINERTVRRALQRVEQGID